MRPVTKRALVSTVVTALLATASILPGNAAIASDTLPETGATESVAATSETPTSSESSPAGTSSEAPQGEQAQGGEASEPSAPTADAQGAAEGGSAPAETSEGTGQPADSAQGNAAPSETPESERNEAATAEQNTQFAIETGYANWDFMRSFREYVGIENETRSNVGILNEGGSLLWNPVPGQSIDLNKLTTLRLQGEVNWRKYEGVLNVSLSNPTIDFAKKQLILSGSTAGTLSGKPAKTFDQVPLLQMDDLKVERKDNYILIHSLKPRVLDMSDDLVGFYKDAIGSPFVMTIALKGVEADTPKPVLWNLFPESYQNPGNKPILDPNEPIIDVDVDPRLAECIRTDQDLKPHTPITNKYIQSVQSLQCISANNSDETKMQSLKGLEGAKTLTSVRFGFNKITDLSPLAALPKLHSVDVPNNEIRDVSVLSGMTALRKIDISGNKISALPDLTALTELANFKADNNRISDISRLPLGSENLRTLSLNTNRIQDVEPLKAALYMRTLNLADNRISDVSAFNNLPNLQRVDLKNNFIPDATAFTKWKAFGANGNELRISALEAKGNRFTNWDVLQEYGWRVKGKPETGQEAAATNPRTLDEALAADRKADEDEAAAQQNEAPKTEDPNVQTPDGQSGGQTPPATEQPAPKSYTAELRWGVRQSFISYLTNPNLAKGKWILSDGAKDSFVFPLADGATISRENMSKIDFKGGVRFIAHKGNLDLSIANPTVINEKGAWKLVADVASRPVPKDLFTAPEVGADTPPPPSKRVTLATLDGFSMERGATSTYNFSTVTLTEEGDTAFGGFYRGGNRGMDPLSIVVTEKAAPAPDPKDQTPDREVPGGTTPGETQPGDSTPGGTKPGTDTPADPRPKAMTADLHWGIRKSFLDYVTGPIAHGTVEVSEGATGRFVFPLADDEALAHRNFMGAAFKGKVRFTGHGGLLDLTIANPAIVREGQAWKLMADVASRPFTFPGARPGSSFFAAASSEVPTLKRVHLADLDGMDVKHGGGGATVSFSSVVLTDEGAAAFGGFYKAGNRALDPITMVVRAADKPSTDQPGTDQPGTDEPGTDEPGTDQPGTDQPGTDQPGTTPAPQLTAPNLNWGVRKQFRSYLKGLAQGSWTLSEGATGEFTFPSVKDAGVDLAKYEGSRFAGKVHFVGHHGLLDITIANPEILRGADGWTLVADVASLPYDPKDMALLGNAEGLKKALEGKTKPALRRVVLATLSDPVVAGSGAEATITFAQLTLTKEGADAFGGFYKAGSSDFDPIVITAGAPVAPPKGGDDSTQDKPSEDQKKNPGTPKVENKTEKKQKKECAVDPNRKRITSGSLSWGVRSSFTTYVRGSIAKGGWNLNGVNWDGSTFNFPVSGGLYNTNTRTGTIYYSGTVQFYGHNGILDLTMSNPAVQIEGNSGTLYMTVSGSDTSGNKFNLGRVALASLSFNGVSVSDNALSFDGASVTLTGTGAKAFAGFYQAGTSLDAMSSSVSLAPATACDPETGELIEYDAFGGIAGPGGLASTGSEAQALVWMSLIALALGAAALGARARQRA
ncbi:HtaA domain-containing protein [Schaalia sp. Marseille-Q2122]|uniref:HtaA domain-containing protein n=1 Tax=Schaalia sp. Marseille-Q2122 TaxID=2736604 RepID=UPI00158B5086|nr:HtaA domain-containing protein [Schaalia sp. Marseille-Q2122]